MWNATSASQSSACGDLRSRPQSRPERISRLAALRAAFGGAYIANERFTFGLRGSSILAALATAVDKVRAAEDGEAVLRELKRGGQAYFLYNEVESIERMHERLARLLPEARAARGT